MRAEPPDPTIRSHVVAIYAYSAAPAILSLIMWVIAYVVRESLIYHFHGRPLPWLTYDLIMERQHLLYLGIAWVVLPFFITRLFRHRPTLVVLFQASVLLYVTLLLLFFFLAAALPWLPFDPGLSH